MRLAGDVSLEKMTASFKLRWIADRRFSVFRLRPAYSL